MPYKKKKRPKTSITRNNAIISAITLTLFASAFITTALQANPAPSSGPTATAVFGASPIYSPGIKPNIIVDEFGALDSALTDQKQNEYQNRIGEWALDGIGYGAYYNLLDIESDIRYTLTAGAQVNPDGTNVTGINAGRAFYRMSPTRSAFVSYLIDSGKLAIDFGASHIFLDSASLDFSTLSFDDEIITAFATYINETGYDIRTLVLSAGYAKTNLIDVTNATLNADTHWAQWRDYDKVIERNFFSTWSTALKNYAISKGKTVQISANRYSNDVQAGDTWVTEDLFDYTLSETFLDTFGYPQKDINFAYKTSVAIGKRFWSWNFPNNTDALDDTAGVNNSSNQPTNNADRVFIAQTFANGGLSQVGGAGWASFISNNVQPVATINDYKLVQSHPELFNLSEASEIGLLYGEYAVKNDPTGLGESFKGASYLLSDAHWLWDVIFTADENRAGFNSDPLTLAKLNEYKTILIPHVQQLSDAQIIIIESYLADATRTVIGFGTVATHSETNIDQTASRTFDDLFGIDAVNTTTYNGKIISFATDLGKSTADNATNSATRTANVTAFNTVVDAEITRELNTTLPSSVQITRFIDTDGSHIYHLVNTDLNLSTDTLTPVTAGATLTVPTPATFTSISIISPETLTPIVSNNLTITLPTLNSWAIIKVGSDIAAATAIDNFPWSQIHLRDSVGTTVDDAFDVNGIRPDTLNAAGEFEYDYWYWKYSATAENPSISGFNFNIAYLATDDVGISQVQLFYRYSADYNVWSGWFGGQISESGINGVDLFTVTSAAYGDGYYQFYTRATDSTGQQERIIKGAETGYGIDTVGPGAPPTFTESNGALHGVWQTAVTSPTFSWTQPTDRFSGAKEAWINIDNLADDSTLATCNSITLPATSTIDPASCSTALPSLTEGRYRVRFQSKDAATNTGEDFAIFELRIGTKTVADPINYFTTIQDGSLLINWEAPTDTNNFDEVTVYVTPDSGPQNIWNTSSTRVITNPQTDTSITVDGLFNGINYRVAIEAFNTTANLPGDLILVANNVAPRVFNYGITMQENGKSTAVTEGGNNDSYTIVLNEKPSADVNIQIATDTQLTATPSTLTLTSTNWETPQTVNLSAVNDSVVETTSTSSISHSITSSDSNYTNLTLPSLSVTVVDNDIAGASTTKRRKKRNFFGCSLSNNGNNNGSGSEKRNNAFPLDPTLPLLLIGSLLYLRKKTPEPNNKNTHQCPYQKK